MAILSYLGFRNIQNEIFLAQKNFNDNRVSFQNEMESAMEKEQAKIIQQTKAASLFLYEQPEKLLDFGNASSFKPVNGIEAIFLFNKSEMVYPSISNHSNTKVPEFSSTRPSLLEKKLFAAEQDISKYQENRMYRSIKTMHAPFESEGEQIQNILGLTRLAYRSKNYDEALKYLEILERFPQLQGYLHPNVSRAVNLLHFDILVEQKKHREAEDYTIKILNQFLQSDRSEDIAAAKFFFESSFTTILSFEDLTEEKREAFWNLRENFNRQLSYMDVFHKHYELFQDLLNDETVSKDGITYKSNENATLFKIGYPLLSGEQIVVAKIDRDAYKKRILSRLKTVSNSWKSMPFAIIDESEKVLLGSVPDSATVLSQEFLGEGTSWEFFLYEKDMGEIKKESRQRMYLMYGLLLFSLITVVLGSIFMFRFLSQERKLLSMKTNFLSSVSHELKTPLTSIKMFAEMMARGRVTKTEKVQEYSALIGKESTRLENLIGAILNYTRMEHGKGAFKWEKLDFSICAQKVFDAVEDIGVEKGLTFHTRFDPNVLVMGDYTALYSLAQNLIENAIKYTNAPGDVTINVYKEDDCAVFSVADTGVGIPSTEQKNIFNDFYRVGDEMTRSTKGSGLGLAIVKRVADTHKATISLSSKPGKGSTFTIRFKKVE